MGTDRSLGPTDPGINKITEAIIGGAFEVSRNLGFGFLEAVYARALVHELRLRNLRIEQEVPFKVLYKGEEVGTFKADLIANDLVIVEIKVVNKIVQPHIAQVLNYLAATGKPIGLIINFGQPKVELKRVIR